MDTPKIGMGKLRITGGVRIGRINATWPFGRLEVDGERLEISSVATGSFIFRPEDITSIDPYVLIPFIGQGIRIIHRVPKYNAKVIFWTFRTPEAVITQIKQTGFLQTHHASP